MTATTDTIPTPEGGLAYDTLGTGPMVLCSPGMGDLRQTYRELTPALAAGGYRAVTVDLRGHGGSDAGFSSYGSSATASDLLAAIDHLDGAPAVVVANSMSAGSAVIAAARRPEAIAALVLTGPFVRDPGASAAARVAKRLLFRAITMPPWGRLVWNAYLPILYAGRRPADFEDYRRSVADSLRRPGRASAFARTTRTSHATAEAHLDRVQCPVLVVMGEKDPDFGDPAAEAAWIADRLSAEVLMVPDAGHYPHAQRPDLVSPAVVDFLDRRLGGSPEPS